MHSPRRKQSSWDESKHLAFRDERGLGKNLFLPREQILDDLSLASPLSRSPFRGVYRIMYILLAMFFASYSYKRYVRTGEPIDLGVFNAIMPDFQRGVLFWIFVSLYTYSALLLQKLKLCGFPGVPLLAFLTQALPFYALSTHIALAKESTFWKCFVWTNAVIHYFKMNSFMLVNRDLEASGSPLYPANVSSVRQEQITFKNFSYFLLAPTACYEPNYPLKPERRIKYCCMKLVLSLCYAIMLFIVVTDFYSGLLQEYTSHSYMSNLFRLVFTQKMFYLLFFLFFFDGMLIVWAQLTRFADRQFYQDFWNSSDYQESNRKWNHVVHQYFYRHVFSEMRNYYKVPVPVAVIGVFLYSAALHELVVYFLFDLNPPFYLISLMLYQLAGQHLFRGLKGSYMGIMLYWVGEMWGHALFVNSYFYDMLNYKFRSQ